LLAAIFNTRCTGLQSFFTLIDMRSARLSIVVATLEYDPMVRWTSPGAFRLASWLEFSDPIAARDYIYALGPWSSFAMVGVDRLGISEVTRWPDPPDYFRVVDAYSPATLRQFDHALGNGVLVLEPLKSAVAAFEDRWTLAYLLEECFLYRGEEVLLSGAEEVVDGEGCG
jgi:hypothetical protein